MPLLRRIARKDHAAIAFTLDGAPCEGRAGDTLLSAILSRTESLRRAEFSGEPRAGFCQMGACQDCWVMNEAGERLRACTTPLLAGMRIVTTRGRSA
ncbi:ferredoxin [Bosea thiooxidans]|jgi:aerobic-type carbon monoxide dehydrogenase small subunit (CoxS/CutS family)|uniref:2Fe-2S iron-sulfur cluster binding domain-containing protein n=1 Tax=Bosea thiooxidans TaxID=53254 RepID=A0A0Q3KR38_9HYPH|nr:(2Fe-2S)-binding protein [Bosea thiooxidans]KQK32259.1 ferredoxin [Bosea thiooxidans]SKC10069.1 2Fe-2S iron-sulfur cluster binding domain-containing protein [Bosea thiooxidans]